MTSRVIYSVLGNHTVIRSNPVSGPLRPAYQKSVLPGLVQSESSVPGVLNGGYRSKQTLLSVF